MRRRGGVGGGGGVVVVRFVVAWANTVGAQVAVSIFFPFYVAAEIPSNMAMKRFRPSIWIPSIMVAWGICTTLMGAVHNYPGLLACRAALGLAEGGLFPGITY